MLLDGEEMDPEEFRHAWAYRQRQLMTLVEALAPGKRQVHVDLQRGRFAWLEGAAGPPVVVADARLIASWGEASQSLLMGWANDGLPAAAVIKPSGEVSAVRDRHGVDANDAFWICAQVAAEVGAHYLYRLPTRAGAVILALWRVRSAAEDVDPAAGFWASARRLVDTLAAVHRAQRDGTLARGAFELDELALHFATEIKRGVGLADERAWLSDEIDQLQDDPDEVDERLARLARELDRRAGAARVR